MIVNTRGMNHLKIPLTCLIQCLLIHWRTSKGGGRLDSCCDQIVGWAIRGLIFGWRKRDFTPPKYPAERICDPQSVILNWLRFSFQGIKGSQGVNLSTHLYVVPVGIATRYGLYGPGIESRWGEIFRTRPDRLWGPPGPLYDGYRVSPGSKGGIGSVPGGKGGRGVMLTTHPPSSAEVMKE